ncbi:hypothetical protein NQ314_003314 [Rhamnusium bicolor]|uniref:Uncharacterized protein n=1 Tax=Rhamnusium bicolor TaxID=1586634 RepID=A0AAV8ZQ03_9CUCU|nr:hypothetical protein NQ314_003314 [Rhamnusium bicolor]
MVFEQPPSKVAKTEVLDEKPAAVDVPTEETKAVEKIEEETMEVDDPVEKKDNTAEGNSVFIFNKK